MNFKPWCPKCGKELKDTSLVIQEIDYTEHRLYSCSACRKVYHVEDKGDFYEILERLVKGGNSELLEPTKQAKRS